MDELKPRLNEVAPPVEAEQDARADDLASLLSAAAEGLRDFRGGGGPPSTYRTVIEQALPSALRSLVPAGYDVRGRTGTGDLADVPWVGIFPNGRSTAKRGVYVVYLFCRDGGRVYLSLMQGTQFVKGGANVLRKRALDIRDSLRNVSGLYLHDISLGSDATLPKQYEAASALALAYEAEAMPSGSELETDLLDLLGLLEALPEHLGLEDQDEPVHLVMKWSVEHNPDTIRLHREVAERQGTVWWGKNGQPGTVSLNATKLLALQEQLRKGITTHCYLYRAGEAWKTRLVAVTDDPSQVDVDRLPAYYGTDTCNLFVEITNFDPIPADWPVQNLVLVSGPDPARMPGALGNQTGPLQVFERAKARRAESQPRERAAEPIAIEKTERPLLDLAWLESETLLDAEWLAEFVGALQRRGQVILAGPPGTGKTWLAKAAARYLTQDETLAYRLLQFHASYGYEDFIEGLRPEPGAQGLTFVRVDGAVLRMVNEIQEGADQRHVLILDEMNRANLPRVFGELMYLLEYRGEPADLLYSRDFVLPERLFFIGSMNTADRSIRSLDIALRRRFEVFEIPPNKQVLQRYYQTHECQVPDLLEGFDRLNERLAGLLDRHHTVGHTFFMADPLTPEVVRSVWTRQLKPLFDDYFFDQPEIADQLALEEFWPSVAGSADPH